MPESISRPLQVFLCHSSGDKATVRELYHRLDAEGWIDVWLDEVKLLPGQDWEHEIEKALDNSDAVIVTLSTASVSKEGYVQRELRYVLDIALEKPEGTIFILPVRLNDCERPRRLRPIQGIDYFPPERREEAFNRLLRSLELRANALGIPKNATKPDADNLILESQKADLSKASMSVNYSSIELDLSRFIEISPTPEVPYTFFIGKYPVTNAQYERFLNAADYATESFWRNFLEFDENCVQIRQGGNEGFDWLREAMGNSKKTPLPQFWNNPKYANAGFSDPDNPVVGINWYEAYAYCNWLSHHWNELAEGSANSNLQPRLVRLPLFTEWTIAAGGESPPNRFPWDTPGNVTDDKKEIVRRANVEESNIEHTTPVYAYMRGASPHGVIDMAGNVWEWQTNLHQLKHEGMAFEHFCICGGCWAHAADSARVSSRSSYPPEGRGIITGFRVLLLLST